MSWSFASSSPSARASGVVLSRATGERPPCPVPGLGGAFVSSLSRQVWVRVDSSMVLRKFPSVSYLLSFFSLFKS